MRRFFTSNVLQHLDPAGWRIHRFGLSVERWGSLRGKSFWVTGAGTGYGRCIALALAAAGAQVFITGRRAEKLAETCASAVSLGIDPAYLIPNTADITSLQDVLRAAKIISRQTPSLCGLVNCAALPMASPGQWPLAELEAEQWNSLLTTNVTGQWLISRAALSLMTKNKCMRILFMTSEAGWASTPGFGPYNVSKAAVNSLGASLAAECAAQFAGHDVQINVLVPGEARTEMNRGSGDSPFSVVCVTLALLSHPSGGPNGCFFHRDGRHLAFGDAAPYPRSLFADDSDVQDPADRSGGARKFRRGLGKLFQFRGHH